MYQFSTTADAETYESIISGQYRTENKIVIGGTTYTNDDYVQATIIGTLMDSVSIGNVCSRSAEITFRGTPEFASGAEVQLYQRVKNTSSTSVWIPKGIYNIYRRYKNASGTQLRVMCYDALYKGDVPFMKAGEWQSTTASSLVTELATLIGVTIESSTAALLSTDSVNIDFIPKIGEDGTTIREMLSYIGIMYAGNWKINDSGQLELVPLLEAN